VSSPLAIGAVSAVLRNLLDNGLVDVGAPLGGVKVTAVAPDSIKVDDANFSPQLNLFLYRVTENQGWRNGELPSFDRDGSRRTSPPLALDLHYLLTAYGVADFQAEILLGYAMHLLHERPVLDRRAIRTALVPSPLGASILPPEFQALTAADLADQLEAVTVTPEPIDTEEMSRLWSAIQAHYRPTTGYLVSVVLIQADRPTTTALPVLSRGRPDPISGREPGVAVSPQLVSPYPSIDRVEAPDPAEPAVVLGEVANLSGHHLDGTAVTVAFSHRLLEDPIVVAVADNADPVGLAVKVPPDAPDPAADPGRWPAGLYTVTATMTRDLEGVSVRAFTGPSPVGRDRTGVAPRSAAGGGSRHRRRRAGSTAARRRGSGTRR